MAGYRFFGWPSDLLPWRLLVGGLKRLPTSYRKQAVTCNLVCSSSQAFSFILSSLSA